MLYFTRRNDRIEFTILILTVRTTGALWLLISQSLEHAAARAGAVISTIVTGFTIYPLSVCTENPIRVDDVMESPKLSE